MPAKKRTTNHSKNRPDADRVVTDLLFTTRNDLPIGTRTDVVALLNARLADCIDLQTQCKHAHWNVKGPQFIALHKLFDEVNEAVEEYVDLIAERIVQLGGIAEGTARVVAVRTALPEYPTQLHTGEHHVGALADALAAFAALSRKAIAEADDLEDDVSADIMTEVTRGVDQWLWFVEAHQQTGPAKSAK